MILVDTDVMIMFARRDPKAVAWFASLAEFPLIPGFVSMELKQGCANRRELAGVERLLQPFSIIWPSAGTCDRIDKLFGPAFLSHSIGIVDTLIAATAIENNATIYTFNLRHFTGVPGVDAQVPYQR